MTRLGGWREALAGVLAIVVAIGLLSAGIPRGQAVSQSAERPGTIQERSGPESDGAVQCSYRGPRPHRDRPRRPQKAYGRPDFREVYRCARRRAAPGSLTSFIAKGTIEGYDTYHVKVPLEIYAKAPNQRKMVYHTQNGDSTSVFDGQQGWLAAVDKPVPLLALLPGAELDSAKLDADLCFPSGIKRALNQWKTDFR